MTQNTTVKASLRELQLTPRKVSLVAALVRGRSVDDALVILSHTPRRAAKPLAKLIASARANATNNHGLKAEGLQIAALSVTAGSRLKRYRPVSRGRAHPFQKRTSHVFVEITGDVKPAAKKPAKVEQTSKSTSVKTGTNSKKEEK
jgi:large subunit ribosomal protein L22